MHHLYHPTSSKHGSLHGSKTYNYKRSRVPHARRTIPTIPIEKKHDISEAFQDEQLDEENMALLTANLKEFSLTPDNSQLLIPERTLAHFATGAKRNNLRVSTTPSASGKNKVRKTHGGTGGKFGKCVFPFVYNANTHFACLPSRKNKTKTWCALSSNYDKDVLWGYCLDDSNEEAKVKGEVGEAKDVVGKEKVIGEGNGSNISTASNHSDSSGPSKENPTVGSSGSSIKEHSTQRQEIKNLIGAVLENEGVSHTDQRHILGDLEGSKKGKHGNSALAWLRADTKSRNVGGCTTL